MVYMCITIAANERPLVSRLVMHRPIVFLFDTSACMLTNQGNERMEERRTKPNYSVYIRICSCIISMTTRHTNVLYKALDEVEIPNADVQYTLHTHISRSPLEIQKDTVKFGNDALVAAAGSPQAVQRTIAFSTTESSIVPCPPLWFDPSSTASITFDRCTA